MTDAEQTVGQTKPTEEQKALHAEAVATLRDAEAKVEAIIERGEVQAALDVARDSDFDKGRTEAVEEINAARHEAALIVNDAIDRIQELMDEADDPEEGERLVAILHASIDEPRPGIRFSDQLEVNEGQDVSGIEAAALRTEATLDAVMLPFLERFEHGMEALDEPEEDVDDHAHALHSDTVNLPRVGEVTVPGGLYTVVFVVLAVVTIVEVILAESPIPNVIAYPVLAALSIGKAVLVVLYYMHLMEDSRIFAWAFGLPLGMAALIIVFLLIVNPFVY